MTQKSIQIKDGVLRELRQQKGLTQTQVAKRARLSENTVANAENGRPVSKRTVREIIKVLDANAELLCIDLERGLYTISKHSPPPTGHDVLSFISDELSGATSTEEFKAKLEMLLKLAGVKEAFISELFEGSLHWTMSLAKVEADRLRSMFDANNNDELIIDSAALIRALERNAQIDQAGKVDELASDISRSRSSTWKRGAIVVLAFAAYFILFLTFRFSRSAQSHPAPVEYPRFPRVHIVEESASPQLLLKDTTLLDLLEDLRVEDEETAGRLKSASELISYGDPKNKALVAKLRYAKALLELTTHAADSPSRNESDSRRSALRDAQIALEQAIATAESLLNAKPNAPGGTDKPSPESKHIDGPTYKASGQ